ncbi:hypothetical protein NDU88_003347 [Pleurodeles waltl]|uniref:Secreted protein n=1 Tax=Pleurodeles waltl TaxID=8319 RepID=A0AAV7QF75_PLEWA|nr:hypothetical protein NDU88_003347 [Pleurodeles waltl]
MSWGRWRCLQQCLWWRCWRRGLCLRGWRRCMCQHLLREKVGCLLQPEAVQVAVQVAVFAAVQVGVNVDRRCDTGPSVSATMPSPDLPFCFWPFPTFDGGAVVLPSLRGTLASLMFGALHDPAVTGTTVPGDVVTEVLGWDLESLALGEGRAGEV